MAIPTNTTSSIASGQTARIGVTASSPPPPPPAQSITLTALAGLSATAGGSSLNFSAQVANPTGLPLNFALETVSGPTATPTPSSSTWILGDLNKAISVAWAAAGTSVIRVRDANNALSNSLSVTVAAAPTPPPPPPPPPPGPAPSPSAAYRNGQKYLFNAIDAAVEPSRLPGGSDLNLNTVGPMRSFVDGAGWPWDNLGGDWIDSTLTRQGSSHWATMATPAAGSATTYSVSVTAALQRVRSAGWWNAWIVSRGTGGNVRTIAGRFNGTTAHRPRIDVVYTDATTATLACRVSAFLGGGSSIPDQASPTYAMSTANNTGEIALEFDLPTKDITSATLYFTVTNHWGASCNINFNLADPPLNTDPVTYGYADLYPLDVGITGHPSTIFSHRYQNGTTLADVRHTASSFNEDVASSWSPDLTGGAANTSLLPYAGQGKWVGSFGAGTDVVSDSYTGEGFAPLATGLGALKIVMPKFPGITNGVEVGQSGTLGANAHLYLPVSKVGARRMFSRYYIRLGNTSDTNSGGAYRTTLAQQYHVLSLGAPTWTDMAGKCSIGFAQKTRFGGNSGKAGGGYGWSMRQEYSDYTKSQDSPSAGGWGRSLSWGADYGLNNVVGHRYLSGDLPAGVTDRRVLNSMARRGGLGGNIYAERWYCIEEEIYLNSVNAPSAAGDGKNWTPDGYFKVWVDGRLAYEQTGVVMRSLPAEVFSAEWQQPVADLGMLSMWFNWFHGGLTENSIDRVVFVTGLVVGESRIGPMNRPADRTGWPTWRTAMAAGTIAEIPTSNRLTDLDPYTLGIVPPAPDDSWVGTGSFTTGAIAWTGGVWDDEQKRFIMNELGGHTDYGGNEKPRLNVGSNAPTWTTPRKPSGAIGMTPVSRFDGAQPSCRYLGDGEHRPGHSYNNQVYVPGYGAVITRCSGAFHAGTNSTAGVIHPGVRKAWRVREDGTTALICDYTSIPNQGGIGVTADDGGATYDPTRGARGTVWLSGHAQTVLIGIDLATGVPTARGGQATYFDTGGGMEWVPGADVLAFLGPGSFKIMRLDQGATVAVSPTLSGSFSSGFSWVVGDGAAFGWSKRLRCFLLWNNSTQTQQLSTLTPTNLLDFSAPWVRGVLALSGSNVFIPPVLGGGGASPYGRGRVAESLAGFFLGPGTLGRPSFWALE